MRYSKAFIPTRKEDPADAEMPSHKLLVRAGYIEQVAAGIYNLLPMGWRAARKIEEIVREEMNRAGAIEMLMPMVQPGELWQDSGRWEAYGSELLRFKDRKDQDYCLGPTHEEVITDLVRRHVRSYRDMPLNLYQIQAKFRDEPRPRAGLLRGREFIMKDAYSFDVDHDAAGESYEKMRVAYTRIFERCGLAFRTVEADTGNIGGSHSHEFQVLAQTGEDHVVSCPECNYTANQEMATSERPDAHVRFLDESEMQPADDTPALEPVDTPGAHTIEDVSGTLDLPPSQLIKTLVVVADTELVAVLLRGDHALNEVKLRNALGVNEVFMATDSDVRKVTGAEVGFAGPVGLDIRIVADVAVGAMHDAGAGANATDQHVIHVEPGRDFEVDAFHDLIMVEEGDPCPKCGTPLEAFRGIEVGHIFLLGTRYSEPMGALYVDDDGEQNPMVMGCYGIGITRVLAAAVEQNHDDDGIIMPVTIAPYEVSVLPLQMNRDDVVEAGDDIYERLRAAGIEALIDDRDMRAGGKFKDADLIGVPYRIVIGGRGLKKGTVELKHRRDDEAEDVPLDEIVDRVRERVDAERRATRPESG